MATSGSPSGTAATLTATPLATAVRSPPRRSRPQGAYHGPAGQADRPRPVGQRSQLRLQSDRGIARRCTLQRATGLRLVSDRGDHRQRGARDHGGLREQHAGAVGKRGARCGGDLLGHRKRFTGQRGFFDLEVGGLDQARVGWNHLVGPDLDHVAGSQP